MQSFGDRDCYLDYCDRILSHYTSFDIAGLSKLRIAIHIKSLQFNWNVKEILREHSIGILGKHSIEILEEHSIAWQYSQLCVCLSSILWSLLPLIILLHIKLCALSFGNPSTEMSFGLCKCVDNTVHYSNVGKVAICPDKESVRFFLKWEKVDLCNNNKNYRNALNQEDWIPNELIRQLKWWK